MNVKTTQPQTPLKAPATPENKDTPATPAHGTSSNVQPAAAEPTPPQQPAKAEPNVPTLPFEPRVWSQPEVDDMLAEAERRGYHRGLNEQIELRMEKSTVDNETFLADETPNEEQLMILRRLRRSVWD